MAFYKMTEGGLLCAPNFVHAPGYSLVAESKDAYTYPADGWYWFDTQAAAESFFAAAAAPIPPTAITKLAFRQRFTAAERVAMEIAQLDDATATMQARQAAAALRASSADLQASKYVDLARTDTQQGVQSLEAFGVIGAGRAAEILGAAIQPIERP